MVVLFRKALAELIGTFAIVFFGCGAIMIGERFQGVVTPASIPVVFGLVVAAMIYALGHISGAHFNPAVTLAFAVSRHFPLKSVLYYWIAQLAGAFLAIGILYITLPVGIGFGATLPAVSISSALAWEIILSFFLMFVIMAVATDTRAVGIMAGAAIGAVVMLDAFVGGAVTGASMNPARSIAPAIIQGNINSLWVYIAGPMLGTTLAALLYQWIRIDTHKNNKGERAQ